MYRCVIIFFKEYFVKIFILILNILINFFLFDNYKFNYWFVNYCYMFKKNIKFNNFYFSFDKKKLCICLL